MITSKLGIISEPELHSLPDTNGGGIGLVKAEPPTEEDSNWLARSGMRV